MRNVAASTAAWVTGRERPTPAAARWPRRSAATSRSIRRAEARSAAKSDRRWALTAKDDGETTAARFAAGRELAVDRGGRQRRAIEIERTVLASRPPREERLRRRARVVQPSREGRRGLARGDAGDGGDHGLQRHLANARIGGGALVAREAGAPIGIERLVVRATRA